MAWFTHMATLIFWESELTVVADFAALRSISNFNCHKSDMVNSLLLKVERGRF